MPTLKIEINTSGVIRAERVVDKSFENMEKASKDLSNSIKMLERSLSDLNFTVPKTTNNIKRLEKDTKSLKRETTALSGAFKTVKAAALGYATVLATMEVIEFSKNIVAQGVALDSLSRTYTAILGSSSAARQEMMFIKDTANSLGLELTVLESSYKDILAASQGTVLEGQGVRNIFTSISKASAVLGMSADDTQGSLRALSQMISKGNVQAIMIILAVYIVICILNSVNSGKPLTLRRGQSRSKVGNYPIKV